MKKNLARGIGAFDGIKGISLLLVVWVHAVSHLVERFPEQELALLFSVLRRRMGFVLAIFFIITGYTWKKSGIGNCIKKQAKILLKPYLIIAFLGMAGIMVYSVLFEPGDVFWERVTGQLAGYCLGISESFSWNDFQIMHTGAAWFLVALFLGWNLLNIIFNLTEKERLRHGLVIGTVIVGMCSTICPVAPFCYSQALLVVGYLYVGYLLNESHFFEKKMGKSFWILCAAVFITTLIWGKTGMSKNQWKLGLYDYLGTITGALCILKFYFSYFNNNSKIGEKLSYIGRNSLWVLCVHAVEMRIAWWFILRQILEKIMPLWDCLMLDFLLQYVIDWTIILVAVALIEKFIKKQKRKKALRRRTEGIKSA